jgi:hypothetical protein
MIADPASEMGLRPSPERASDHDGGSSPSWRAHETPARNTLRRQAPCPAMTRPEPARDAKRRWPLQRRRRLRRQAVDHHAPQPRGKPRRWRRRRDHRSAGAVQGEAPRAPRRRRQDRDTHVGCGAGCCATAVRAHGVVRGGRPRVGNAGFRPWPRPLGVRRGVCRRGEEGPSSTWVMVVRSASWRLRERTGPR